MSKKIIRESEKNKNEVKKPDLDEVSKNLEENSSQKLNKDKKEFDTTEIKNDESQESIKTDKTKTDSGFKKWLKQNPVGGGAAIALGVIVIIVTIVASILALIAPTIPKTPEVKKSSSSSSQKSSASSYSSSSKSYSSQSSSTSSKKSNVIDYQSLKTQPSQWASVYDAKYIDKNDTNGFQALYLDKTKSGEDKFVEKLANVPNPVFADVSDNSYYKGVKGLDVALYYFGYLDVSEEKVIAVNVNQSWADTRIFFNDKFVLKTEHDGYTEVKLPKGRYEVRIEFTAGNNNEHIITFQEPQKTYSLSEVKKLIELKLVPSNLENYNFYVASVYEAKELNKPLKLDIQKSDKPIFLVLSSYESVNWELTGEGADKVEYAVVSSYTKGSSLKTSNTKTVGLILENSSGERLASIDYKLVPTCYSSGAREVEVRCESEGFITSADQLKTFFGKRPDGFSGNYGTNQLKVPQTILTPEEYQKIEEQIKNVKKNGSPRNSGEQEDCVTTAGGDMICGGAGEDIIYP